MMTVRRFDLHPLASSTSILLGAYLWHTFFCVAEPKIRRATSAAVQSRRPRWNAAEPNAADLLGGSGGSAAALLRVRTGVVEGGCG